MSDKSPRICPDCGSDTFFADNFERVRDEAFRLRKEFEHQAARHAVERAQWELQRFDNDEGRRGMQEKIQRQRKVINRLERRLRALSVKPYAQESGTEEAS